MSQATRGQVAEYPVDVKTGLTQPLSKFLGSRDLDRHRAMVAVELEVMAKKMDRFGWERDRGSAAHDRLIVDWMNALQDYPLAEVQEACRAWVLSNPRKMPNEGDIRGVISSHRREAVARHKHENPIRDYAEPTEITDEERAKRKAFAESVLGRFAK